MAALTQTRANVGIGGPCRLEAVKVGEAVLQGQPGYQLTTSGLWMKASKATQAAAKAACIFLTPGSGDVVIVRGDGMLVNLGATLVIGKTYAVDTAGAIIELSELVSGDWITHLGQAVSTSLLKTKFNITDIQVP
jgi:hypothetical protein